ncbi:helix-turn-helix domain-containing protein [Corallococcus macrosporus]|uniref:Helix-turn-helix domain-containing protein n=1 Tax=Corallococcus macrosporus TaxID=35 RepID=A0ABS3D986_9BACT|nr:helix-turn-helix domain-containing protein [Corallococcus macrosporus]MBN8226900.1 helix-turn-helix domain-containing protein [Corallococcus macrosporus]
MKPFAQQTYYELLEVPPTASDAEIRAAHQRLMELYSPDSIAVYALGDPDQVDALRERMNEAMEMLTDADLRVEYDRSIGLSTERLAKAAVTADAADKVDSAARVAEALATAAAALAKAAGAVDAERLEAESRLKAAASVSDTEGEAPRASETPGKSEERMRVEESKRQESSGKDAPGVPSEPVMVGGVAVVEAFRASFTRSLSFVYVPTAPLRGQGRGAAEAPAVEAKPSAPEAEAPSAPAPVEAVVAPAEAPEPGVSAPASTPAQDVAAQAPVPSAPEPSASVQSETGATVTADGSAPASDRVEAAPAPAVTSPVVAEAAPQAPAASSPPASEAAPQAPAVEASAEPPASRPVPEASAVTSPAEPGGSVASAPDASSAAVATTQGESDPNPAPGAPALDASTTALARTPATGASRGAVRPLTSRPIDSRPAANSPSGPGTVKGPTVRKLGDAQVLAQDSAIATAESALAQVAAKVREARPRGVDIPADAEFNGELLRRVREARGLSIQQLADRTRISVRHLENVEADRYTALPTTVYLRGILMNLARELGLDPLRVSKSYLALFSEKPAKSGR